MDKIKKVTQQNGIEDIFMVETECGPEATLKLADISHVSEYKEKNNRVLWFVDEVTDRIMDYSKLIVEWNREDELNNIPVEKRKPIVIAIASPGGELLGMWNFVDILLASKTKIITVNLSYCYSAGALIHLCGSERYTFPHGTILYHNGSGTSGGNYSEAVAQTESWKNMVKLMQDFILSRTKISKQMLAKKLKTDWYIDASKSVELGINDSIITTLDVLLNI